MKRNIVKPAWLALILSGIGVAGGCRGEPEYVVTGKVHFAGEPVTFGSVRLTPDLDRGNDGPSLTIPITEGRFTTQGARAPATPGSNIAVVEVAAGSAGEPRSTYYELPVTLPSDGATDFSIDLSTVPPVR